MLSGKESESMCMPLKDGKLLLQAMGGITSIVKGTLKSVKKHRTVILALGIYIYGTILCLKFSSTPYLPTDINFKVKKGDEKKQLIAIHGPSCSLQYCNETLVCIF